MVGFLARAFNCTPSEAIAELKHNPWIWDVIAAESYRLAFIETEAWNNMDAEQRKGQTAPSGPWVRRVAANRTLLLREQFEDRDEALRDEGRVL